MYTIEAAYIFSIILLVLVGMGWMMWKVNDRASRVEMPAPDNTSGIYHTTDSNS